MTPAIPAFIAIASDPRAQKAAKTGLSSMMKLVLTVIVGLVAVVVMVKGWKQLKKAADEVVNGPRETSGYWETASSGVGDFIGATLFGHRHHTHASDDEEQHTTVTVSGGSTDTADRAVHTVRR